MFFILQLRIQKQLGGFAQIFQDQDLDQDQDRETIRWVCSDLCDQQRAGGASHQLLRLLASAGCTELNFYLHHPLLWGQLFFQWYIKWQI